MSGAAPCSHRPRPSPACPASAAAAWPAPRVAAPQGGRHAAPPVVPVLGAGNDPVLGVRPNTTSSLSCSAPCPMSIAALHPPPAVEGHTTPGGYSSKAVKPIALAKCMAIAQVGGRRPACQAGPGPAGPACAPVLSASLAGVCSPQCCRCPRPAARPRLSKHPPCPTTAADDQAGLPRPHSERAGRRQHGARRGRVHPAGLPHRAGKARPPGAPNAACIRPGTPRQLGWCGPACSRLCPGSEASAAGVARA